MGNKSETRVGVSASQVLVYRETELGGVIHLCTKKNSKFGDSWINTPIATTAAGCVALAEGLKEMAVKIEGGRKWEISAITIACIGLTNLFPAVVATMTSITAGGCALKQIESKAPTARLLLWATLWLGVALE